MKSNKLYSNLSYKKGLIKMITLNNKNYIKQSKQNTTDSQFVGYYKKNKISVFIYDLAKILKYAIRLNDGMVCRATKLKNGRNWYQYHLSNNDFKGWVTAQELDMLRSL